jgi:hypothetical protein
MSDGLSTLAYSLPELRDVPFNTNNGRSGAPATSTHPTWWKPKESSPVHPQPRKERLDFTSIMMEHQQASDVTQLYMGNINLTRNYFP